MNMLDKTILVAASTLIVQTTILLAVGLGFARTFRWNAAGRHTFLLALLASVSVLPVVAGIFQSQDVSMVPLIAAAFRNAPIPDQQVSPQPEYFVYSYAVSTVHPMVESGATMPNTPAAPSIGTMVLLAWGTGVLFLSVRMCIGVSRLAWIRRRACLSLDCKLTELSTELSQRLMLTRSPQVFQSDRVRTPVAVGIARPAILVPRGLVKQLSDAQLTDILVHELAHIKRRDHLVLVFQKFVSIVFWPQPLLYFLNRELSKAREEICDNHVLKNSERTQYGETLLRLTECVSPAFSLGLFGGAWKLEDRISQLLSDRRKIVTNSNVFTRCFAMTLLGVLTATVSLGTPPLDADEHDRAEHSEHADHHNDGSGIDNDDGHRSDHDSDVGDVKRRNQFRFETEDGNLMIGGPGKANGVLYLTNRESFDVYVSPSDKKKADRLQEKYDRLTKEQNEISSKLTELEGDLRRLGVKLKRTHHEHAISGNRIIEFVPSVPSMNVVEARPKRIRGPRATRAARAPRSVRAIPARPSALAAPLANAPRSVRVITPPPTAKSHRKLEERLERLERMLEKMIESKEGSDETSPY